MWLLILGYFGFLVAVLAAAAKLAARLHGRHPLVWQQSLVFGAGAGVFFNVGAYAGMGSGAMALVYPFLLLVSWGTGCFHLQLRSPGNSRLALGESFVLAFIVVGQFIAVIAAIGGVLILVDGPPMQGGG
jgi:hypothetical protein